MEDADNVNSDEQTDERPVVRWIGQPEPVTPRRIIVLWVVLGVVGVGLIASMIALPKMVTPAPPTTTAPDMVVASDTSAQSRLRALANELAADDALSGEAEATRAAALVEESGSVTRYLLADEDRRCWMISVDDQGVTAPIEVRGERCV